MESEQKRLLENFGNRDAAIQMPIFHHVASYVSREYHVPKLLHTNSELAYHYTNAEGFFGIVKSNRFWASHYRFLNDPTERQYAMSVATNHIQSRANESDLAARFAHAVMNNTTPSELDFYVVSFCQEGDLLSQWRGYGSFGDGYALGFETDRLRPHPQVGSLIEIIYDRSHLEKIVADLFAIYIEHLTSAERSFVDESPGWFREIVDYLSQGYKHPSYCEEQEIRLLFSRYGDFSKQIQYQNSWEPLIDHRSRGSDILPYINAKLDFEDDNAIDPKLPLKEIVIGPGVEFERNANSIDQYLQANGYENVEIKRSVVPFRA